jgi:hypothetical protein
MSVYVQTVIYIQLGVLIRLDLNSNIRSPAVLWRRPTVSAVHVCSGEDIFFQAHGLLSQPCKLKVSCYDALSLSRTCARGTRPASGPTTSRHSWIRSPA